MNELRQRNGFTLIEMVLVIVIMGIISTIAMKSLQSSTEQRRFDATTEEMEVLARAIVGDERLVSGGVRADFGYVGDVGALPSSLDDLIANPGGYATWKGPYFRVDFSEHTDDHQRDAWNELYTYTGGVTIASSGGGSAITRELANSVNDLTLNTINGIVRDNRLSPPGDSASSVTITIRYPNGSGATTSASATPSNSGEFSFSSLIPIGIHAIEAVINADTVSKFVAVYPGRDSYTELRFSSNVW
ncbi:MAG: type II secretion system protein [candidate division Zixibacteria bacterium]|nr:type II secretion system protein [candidate division Zixibacteria bacterium]